MRTTPRAAVVVTADFAGSRRGFDQHGFPVEPAARDEPRHVHVVVGCRGDVAHVWSVEHG
ncbi:MAG: hypothetical protein AAGA99_04720 [Actinomycetota bacterium]